MFETYTDALIAALPNLAFAVIILIVFYFLGKFLSRFVLRAGKTGKLGRANVYQLLASVVKIGSIIIGVLTALGTAGVNITPLIAGLGLSGLAISLALKDAVTNLINGILILIYEPFNRGDIIKIGSAKGTVGEINLRYIQIINEEDGTEYLVPNSQAFAKEVQKFKPKEEER